MSPEQAFAVSLAEFQAEMPHIKKGQKATVRSDKGNYSYEYADLTDITEVAMPVLSAHGLSFFASPSLVDGAFVLRYALKHTGGHEEGGTFPLPDPSRSTPQQIGSWLTYARRYCLCAVTGIAPGGDDDDAVGATDARAADPLHAPKKAQRSGPPADPSTTDDPWATAAPKEPERVTDIPWLEGFRQRITAAGKPSELRGLQEEANVMWAEHKLSREDAAAIKAEVAQRDAELKGALI